MTSQQNTFVFIGEDQQKKYSKTTLSAINAQVAKYAHKQRQATPSKARSLPTSPHLLDSSNNRDVSTQSNRSRRPSRRASDTICAIPRTKESDTGVLHSKQSKERQLSVSKVSRQKAAGVDACEKSVVNNSGDDRTAPEDLNELFEKLCRITKLPTYQAFPFFLNLEERRLAHYWLTEVIQEDFGMSKSRFEDSFQSCLIKYPLAYQVPLRWMIAHAAQRLHDRTGSHSLAVVYRNQQDALMKLQDVLTDQSISVDELISSVHHTIVHDPDSRKLHLRGSDALIEARGGLESVFEQCTVNQPDHLFLQYTFAPFDIDRYEELEKLKRRFFEGLLAIQGSSVEYVQIKTQMDSWASTVDLADCTDQGAGRMQKWYYTQQRERIFGPETTMGQLIRKDFDQNATWIAKTRLFGALFYLGATLIEYDTIEEKCMFFRQLEKSADVLSPVCVDSVTGSKRIMPGTFIFMVAHVDRQIKEQLNSGHSNRRGIRTAVTGIAALKLYGLFPDSMRDRLQSYLRSWLLGQGNAYLKDSDIDALSSVITQLWLQQNRSSMSPERELPDYFDRGHSVPMDTQVAEAAEMVQSLADEYLQFSELEGFDYFQDSHEKAPFVSATTVA